MNRQGTVVEFNADAGLGTVLDDSGTEYRFHCVEIADGTRTIDVGAAVAFRLVSKLGDVEAADVRSR